METKTDEGAVEEIKLIQVSVNDVRTKLFHSNFIDETLDLNCAAYNIFAEKVDILPSNHFGEADDLIETYINDQFDHNPGEANMNKTNELMDIVKIMHAKLYVDLPMAKDTLSIWGQHISSLPAPVINSPIARAFASFLHRSGEPYAAATLVVQQAAWLRASEVFKLTANDIRLPGDAVLNGAGERVAGLVINNGKTPSYDKPKLVIVEDPTAVKVLEIFMYMNSGLPREASIPARISYSHYFEKFQMTEKYYGLETLYITPHGADISKPVEHFHNWIPLDDMAEGERCAELSSAIASIKNDQASIGNINMNSYMKREIEREEALFRNVVEKKWKEIQKRKAA